MSDNIVVDGSSGDVFVFVEMVIGYDELSSEHFEKFETPKTRENFENIDKLQKNNTVPGSIQYHKLKIQSHQITVKMIFTILYVNRIEGKVFAVENDNKVFAVDIFFSFNFQYLFK